MNWYKKANIIDDSRVYDEEEILEYLNAILYEEMEGSDLKPEDKMRIREDIENKLNSFPPGYKLKKDMNGWSVVSPDGNIVSLNEKQLMHSVPGGKARFDFMEKSI